jgi:hypothetical protein
MLGSLTPSGQQLTEDDASNNVSSKCRPSSCSVGRINDIRRSVGRGYECEHEDEAECAGKTVALAGAGGQQHGWYNRTILGKCCFNASNRRMLKAPFRKKEVGAEV